MAKILKPFDDFKWTIAERTKVLSALVEAEGAKYKLGAKWPKCEPNPTGPIDCSGLVSWAFSICGLFLPDGSFNQIKVCKPFPGNPVPLCLGFADLHPPAGVVDHVNIVLDKTYVIEARADFDKVVLRPVVNWQKQKGFLGWHFIEGTLEV